LIVSTTSHTFFNVEKYTLRIWDVESGTPLQILKGHTNSVNSANFSPDGQFIVSTSLDNTVRIWDVESRIAPQTLDEHTWGVTSVNFSVDGQLIVSTSDDTTVRIWEAKSHKLLKILPEHAFSGNTTNFSPDGKFIVSSADKAIKVWVVDSGELLTTFTGHTSSVSSVNFSADSKVIVSTAYDATVRIWDVETRQELERFEDTRLGYQQLKQKYPQVTKIWNTYYKHTNGRELVFGFSGQLIVQDGERTYTFYGDAGIGSAAWSPDGVHLVVGDGVGRVLLLRIQE
jgi:WD40 repeat protein